MAGQMGNVTDGVSCVASPEGMLKEKPAEDPVIRLYRHGKRPLCSLLPTKTIACDVLRTSPDRFCRISTYRTGTGRWRHMTWASGAT